jgi:hypothetical protein
LFAEAATKTGFPPLKLMSFAKKMNESINMLHDLADRIIAVMTDE